MITDKLQVIHAILPVYQIFHFYLNCWFFFFLMRLRRNHYITIYSIIGLKMQRVYFIRCINIHNSIYNVFIKKKKHRVIITRTYSPAMIKTKYLLWLKNIKRHPSLIHNTGQSI